MPRFSVRNFIAPRMIRHVAVCCLLLFGAVLALPTQANCYKVTSTTGYDPYRGNFPSGYTLTAADGAAQAWNSANSNVGGSLGLPGVINVTSDTSFQPIGTVIASSVTPFIQWSNGSTPYNPNQILFLCDKADASSLYETYAIHGNERYSEYFQVPAIPGAYYTNWTNVAIRIKNMTDGNYFALNWQQRLMTGLDLDHSGQYLLVKAKNFSAIQVELIRSDNGSSVAGTNQGTNNLGYSSPYTDSQTGSYSSSYGLGYVAFSGPGIAPGNAPVNGVSSSDGGASPGFSYYWPGMVDLYSKVKVRHSSTCAITNVTPVVTFPTVTVAQLNSGVTPPSQSFTINYNCQTGAVTSNTYADTSTGSGTCNWSFSNTYSCVTTSGSALGFLPSPAAVAAAQRFGSLKTASTGLTYLLSDQYPATGVSNGIARGVGIQIFRANSPTTAMNLLSVNNTAGNTSTTSNVTANTAGWYKLVDTSTKNLGGNNYSEKFQATLVKLPASTGEAVTAGRVYSTAQVLNPCPIIGSAAARCARCCTRADYCSSAPWRRLG
jgi:Fimbrial protein